jgi:hypothetical protein
MFRVQGNDGRPDTMDRTKRYTYRQRTSAKSYAGKQIDVLKPMTETDGEREIMPRKLLVFAEGGVVILRPNDHLNSPGQNGICRRSRGVILGPSRSVNGPPQTGIAPDTASGGPSHVMPVKSRVPYLFD